MGLTISIQITADNGQGSPDVQSFQIDVAGVAPAITSTPGSTVTVFDTYTYTIVATGDPAPTFSVSGEPSWLTLAGNVLSGTPGAGDIGPTGNITITAENGQSPDATQTFQISVQGIAPDITSTPVTSVRSGDPYSYTVEADGTPAPTLQVTSTLPSWLSFDSATGVLSGTPNYSTDQTYNITITASNGWTPVATQSFTLLVEARSGGSDDSGCSTSEKQSPVWLIALASLLLLFIYNNRRTAHAN
jgi:large repetitive protein